MKIRPLFIAAAALLIFAAGCDKTTDPSSSDKPVLAVASISLPAANMIDTCNAKAYTYAATAQALIQFATVYANPALGTSVNGVWTWSITESGVNATMTARLLDDGRYSWKLVLNGTDTDDGTVYSNWTAFEATSSADGKSGTLTIYDDSPTPSTTVDLVVTWSTGANNVATVELEFVQENVKFVLVSNGTTGEVTEYVKVGGNWIGTGFHATWTGPGALATC